MNKMNSAAKYTIGTRILGRLVYRNYTLINMNSTANERNIPSGNICRNFKC